MVVPQYTPGQGQQEYKCGITKPARGKVQGQRARATHRQPVLPGLMPQGQCRNTPKPSESCNPTQSASSSDWLESWRTGHGTELLRSSALTSQAQNNISITFITLHCDVNKICCQPRIIWHQTIFSGPEMPPIPNWQSQCLLDNCLTIHAVPTKVLICRKENRRCGRCSTNCNKNLTKSSLRRSILAQEHAQL